MLIHLFTLIFLYFVLTLFGCCLGADVISFDGHGVISYRFRSKKIKILKDVISLKFKTTSEDGVLLHGEGQQGDYISLELRRARLQLSINLGSEHVSLQKEPKVLLQSFNSRKSSRLFVSPASPLSPDLDFMSSVPNSRMLTSHLEFASTVHV